ncbi:MAG: hypothetical protein IKT68_06810 [Clostridia bacterium]|nr:hypothetical protein [Clostridia bacterium]
MGEKRYTENGYLIVTETDTCGFWELDAESSSFSPTRDCFYCKFAEFRTREFINKVEGVPKKGKWYSICHNEKNQKPKSEKEENHENEKTAVLTAGDIDGKHTFGKLL